MLTPRRIVMAARLGFALAALGMAVLMLGPFQGLEQVFGLNDKAAHVIAFYGLASGLFLIAPSQRQDTIADAERLGMSPEAAREAGNNAGLMTAGLTALTGGAGGMMSKLTGASAKSLPSALANRPKNKNTSPTPTRLLVR